MLIFFIDSIVLPTKQQVPEHGAALLNCEGSRGLKVWFLDGKLINPSKQFKMLTGSIFILPNVTKSNEGKYACYKRNRYHKYDLIGSSHLVIQGRIGIDVN